MKNRIVYISIEDSSDKKTWSGSNYYIRKAIEDSTRCNLFVIDNLKTKPSVIDYVCKIISKIMHKHYDFRRSKTVLKNYAKQISSQLPNSYDVILSSSSLGITYLKTEKPIYFYTDATFNSMLDYYFHSDKWCKKSIQDAEYHEQKSIDQATAIFYSSEWAKNNAIKHYKKHYKKVKVVPFGANTNYYLNDNYITKLINNRIYQDTVYLLFIGVDWYRKGGDKVLTTAKQLTAKGIKVQLDIVGISKLPKNTFFPNYVINHGFIDKNSKVEKEKLEKLFMQATFLFVPSQMECYGLVFAEANSVALPSLTTNTGGIPSVITHEYNGYTMPLEAKSTAYTNVIIDLLNDNEKYYNLSHNAYKKYCDITNWKTAGKQIIDYIEKE